MSPYMYESINKTRGGGNESDDKQHSDRLNAEDNKSSSMECDISPKLSQNSKAEANKDAEEKEILYDLAGIVVHSGQANAGHYYSFIRGFKQNKYDCAIKLLSFPCARRQKNV